MRLDPDQAALVRAAVAEVQEAAGLANLAARTRAGEMDQLPVMQCAFAAAAAVADPLSAPPQPVEAAAAEDWRGALRAWWDCKIEGGPPGGGMLIGEDGYGDPVPRMIQLMEHWMGQQPARAPLPAEVRDTLLYTFGGPHLGCHVVCAHDAWHWFRAAGVAPPEALQAAAVEEGWARTAQQPPSAPAGELVEAEQLERAILAFEQSEGRQCYADRPDVPIPYEALSPKRRERLTAFAAALRSLNPATAGGEE